MDQHAWSPNVPAKLGLYHAFTRTHANAARDHTTYVVVSGCLTHAAEELHNLWLDAGQHATCGELLDSQVRGAVSLAVRAGRTRPHRRHR